MQSWVESLRASFMPTIRSRGKKYFENNRVDLKQASEKAIEATVNGTIAYNVFLKHDGSNDIGISCSCPFFRQGYPCKHLWAAILAADRFLNNQSAGKKKKKNPKKLAKHKKKDWRNLFNEEGWNNEVVETPWSKGTGVFKLFYRLLLVEEGAFLTAFEQYIKKNNTFGRTRKLKEEVIQHPGLPENDRIVLSILQTGAEDDFYDYIYGFRQSDMYENVSLSNHYLSIILPRLADTGRCEIVFSNKQKDGKILTRHTPFEGQLKFNVKDAESKKKNFLIEPVIHFGEGYSDISINDKFILFNTKPLLLLLKNRICELKGPDYEWLKKLVETGVFNVSKKEIREFTVSAEQLFAGSGLMELPDSISPEIVEVSPAPVLVVSIENTYLNGTLLFDYNGIEIDFTNKKETILDKEAWKRIIRDFKKENEFKALVIESGFEINNESNFMIEISESSYALNLLDSKDVRVEAVNRKPVSPGRITNFTVKSGVDWFDLEGGIDFGDEIVPLSRVIKAFLKGNKTIRLSSGGTGVLPEEWLKRHSTVIDMGVSIKKAKKSDERLRFHSSQALLLDSMLEKVEMVSIDEKFLETRNRIKNFSGIQRKEPVSSFKGELRSYQKDALGWFCFLEEMHFGGVLADDMGLGKTVQVLARLAELKESSTSERVPSLVVAPTSLVFNWQCESKKFVPDLRLIVYTGTKRKELLDDFQNCDLVITTYGIARIDIKELSDINFKAIILDESQAIKNASSQIARSVRLLKAEQKLCLTGTPLENHVGELWSQMEFLNPGLLGSWSAFERRFMKPVATGDEEALDSLKQLVTPFILRRTKDKVAAELPEKVENVVYCEMSKEQQDIYSSVRDHYRSSIISNVKQKGIAQSKMHVLEGLLRLRQAANHPALIGHENVESGKLNELLTLIDEAVQGGHKALVFSQFTGMLSLVRKSLDEKKIRYEYLDGRTPSNKRREKVENFQSDAKIDLFLISLKAGGVGLNLTAADYVFLVDPWWNPAVELQAVDRTHRIGQEKKVFTYKLITSGSIEEKVLKLQKDKQTVVDSIISGSQDIMKNLTAADLEVLFS